MKELPSSGIHFRTDGGIETSRKMTNVALGDLRSKKTIFADKRGS